MKSTISYTALETENEVLRSRLAKLEAIIKRIEFEGDASATVARMINEYRNSTHLAVMR